MELIKKIAPLVLAFSMASLNVSAMQKAKPYKSLTLTLAEQREQLKQLTTEDKTRIQTVHQYIEIAQAEIEIKKDHTKQWLNTERNRRFRQLFQKKKLVSEQNQ